MSEPTSGDPEPVIRYFPEGSEIRWSHCPAGWAHLLDQITSALDEHLPGWQLRQVKSDLGALDVYLDAPRDASSAQLSAARAVHRAMWERSSSTCEVCGTQGRRALRAGWVSVLCTEHEVMAGTRVPMVELRVRGSCPRCGHPEASHAPDARLKSAPRVCLEPAGMGTECGCPLVETLPMDAVGDFEVMTSNGTRYFLRLGGDDPRWFRSPGPTSRGEYAERWNRPGSLRSDGVEQATKRPVTPHALRVGSSFTVGIASSSDPMHESRILWIRQVLDSTDLPVEVEYCRACNRISVLCRDGLCADCRDE